MLTNLENFHEKFVKILASGRPEKSYRHGKIIIETAARRRLWNQSMGAETRTIEILPN